jgi:hypothetical protein
MPKSRDRVVHRLIAQVRGGLGMGWGRFWGDFGLARRDGREIIEVAVRFWTCHSFVEWSAIQLKGKWGVSRGLILPEGGARVNETRLEHGEPMDG